MSKTILYGFWYDYVKQRYKEKAKLCYLGTDNFIVYIKTEGINVVTAKGVETNIDTSNYEKERPLPIEKNKKVNGLMKDELGGKIMTEFATLRPNSYSHLTEEKDEYKKAKNISNVIHQTFFQVN